MDVIHTLTHLFCFRGQIDIQDIGTFSEIRDRYDFFTL